MRTPEELEVGRRNLVAQLKRELQKAVLRWSKVELDQVTVRDLIEVLDQPAGVQVEITDEAAWRHAVEAEMRLRGYSEQEIREAAHHSCKEFGCEFDWNHRAYVCTDEEGNSAHPIADEYGELVGVIGRALEAAAPLLGTRPQPTLGEVKATIRTALGGDTEEGCGCESHICEAASRVQKLFGGAPPALLDRDAVENAIATKAMYYDSGTAVHEVDDNDLAGLVAATDAIMALVRPLPTREQIREVVIRNAMHREHHDDAVWIDGWADDFTEALGRLLRGGEK